MIDLIITAHKEYVSNMYTNWPLIQPETNFLCTCNNQPNPHHFRARGKGWFGTGKDTQEDMCLGYCKNETTNFTCINNCHRLQLV